MTWLDRLACRFGWHRRTMQLGVYPNGLRTVPTTCCRWCGEEWPT